MIKVLLKDRTRVEIQKNDVLYLAREGKGNRRISIIDLILSRTAFATGTLNQYDTNNSVVFPFNHEGKTYDITIGHLESDKTPVITISYQSTATIWYYDIFDLITRTNSAMYFCGKFKLYTPFNDNNFQINKDILQKYGISNLTKNTDKIYESEYIHITDFQYQLFRHAFGIDK